MGNACRNTLKHMGNACRNILKHMGNACRNILKHMGNACRNTLKHMGNATEHFEFAALYVLYALTYSETQVSYTTFPFGHAVL